MSSQEIKTIKLPYEEHGSLFGSSATSFDNVQTFKQMLPNFLKLDQTRYPSRRGGIIKLTHSSGLKTAEYNELVNTIINARFDVVPGNYDLDENRLNTDYYRDMLLLDLIAMPGVDKYGDIIGMQDGYFGYFSRPTFTAPFKID